MTNAVKDYLKNTLTQKVQNNATSRARVNRADAQCITEDDIRA